MKNYTAQENQAGRVAVVKNLFVYRGRTSVVSDFSISLDKGDFLALIGANGSGKTTILRAMMGFVPFQRGTIRMFPENKQGFGGARKKTGYVPQNLSVDFRMPVSVRDVVAMGRLGRKSAGRFDEESVETALEDTGLQHLASRPFGHLSGGERQKAHIARAICGRPELLLLDEPTANLDLGAQRDCLDLIGALHSKYNLTTIIVMHDLASLPVQCNRAVVIDGSRKVFDGLFTDVFTETNLAHVYKGRTKQVLEKLMDELPGRKRDVNA